MIPIKLLAKRAACLMFGNHNFDEHTKLRWCLKCGWVEIKDNDVWIPYVDGDNEGDVSPEEQRVLADELMLFLNYAESKGWK